jgi:hypothetical protein
MAKTLNDLTMSGGDWPEFAEWLALELANDAEMRWQNENPNGPTKEYWESDARMGVNCDRQKVLMTTMLQRDVTTWRHFAMLVAVAVSANFNDASPRNAFALGRFEQPESPWDWALPSILTLLGQHIIANNILPEVPFEDHSGLEG